MNRIIDGAQLLWRDDSWRIAALLLVPSILVSLLFDSPVGVLVGGAATVGLLVISTRRMNILRRDEPQDPARSSS